MQIVIKGMDMIRDVLFSHIADIILKRIFFLSHECSLNISEWFFFIYYNEQFNWSTLIC